MAVPPRRECPHPMTAFESAAFVAAIAMFYLYSWLRDVAVALWDTFDAIFLTTPGQERPTNPLVVRTPEER